MNPIEPSNDPDTDRPDDLSFEMLVNQARSGDKNAVGALIERYRNYLLFIANNDVDSNLQSKMGASDAVQESILHAQFNFDQFQGKSETEWKAWLSTILANDIRKERRKFLTSKRNANLEINLQEQSAVGRNLFDAQPTPGSEAIAREKTRAIHLAISQLSKEQQQVIQLRNFERLGFAEIAGQMQRSEDAARKFWARAIEALKISMKSISPDLIDDSRHAGPDHE